MKKKKYYVTYKHSKKECDWESCKIFESREEAEKYVIGMNYLKNEKPYIITAKFY